MTRTIWSVATASAPVIHCLSGWIRQAVKRTTLTSGSERLSDLPGVDLDLDLVAIDGAALLN